MSLLPPQGVSNTDIKCKYCQGKGKNCNCAICPGCSKNTSICKC